MPVNRVLLCISFLVFFTVLPTGEVNAQEQILDDFETPRARSRYLVGAFSRFSESGRPGRPAQHR